MGPRRSLRTSGSSVAQTTPAKRTAAAAATSAQTTRQSRRGNPKGTKSRYFKDNSTAKDADDSDEVSEAQSTPSAAAAEASGYEDEDASASEPSDSSEPASDTDFDESARPAKKRNINQKRLKPTNAVSNVSAARQKKSKELWRPGVSAGLGPGTQLVIDKPKARPEGKIKYTNDTIHPNTMLFLKDLAENNDREWLKMHDPDYRTSWNDFTSFLECVQEKLIEIDDEIPELPVKDVFFRIYRDVRFSSDQTPYKPWFSAAWSRTGRKGPYGCYYCHIQPGASFVGGGLWMPEAQALAALRNSIDRKPHIIKRVLTQPQFRREFLGGIKDDEKKAVRAFAAHNAQNALKTRPKGYDADHKEIDLLKLRNFTIGRKLSDDEIVGSKGVETLANSFSCLREFVRYLNGIVMPDDPDNSSDDEAGTE